ncbi:hypothetical protein SUGI_0254300 [Cryptomeria japonica]|uniref:uncharacterized protein LOC131080013 n=1 Tax=Cryptomeria japonica TaxID=3369 RepID=UPI002408C367|nr:uncharacterized protein LOC131080013 [Cryptomeria japonica]GLJ15489.1 hypothetical protein SUGI_0254300 [Cryptomeria japonica]
MNSCWKVSWVVFVFALWGIAEAHSRGSSYFENPSLRIKYNALAAESLVSCPQSRAAHHLGRTLLQESNSTGGDQQNGTYTALVARNRIDPLDHFKRYKGGYDIENKHYWASTVFTGAYGYAIAAVWTIVGVLYGTYLVVKSCCCNKNRKNIYHKPHSDAYYIWEFRALILLTLVIIVTSGIVLAGNTRFHTRAKRVERTVLGAADSATETVDNVTSTMKIMQEDLRPYDKNAYERLNETAETLQKAALNIHDKVYKNKHAVDIGLRILYITVAVLVSINLGFVVSAVAIFLLHWRRLFYLIIIICSLMTTLSWAYCGFSYAIHTFAKDTCLALKEYQVNPYNTTLNAILPCMDLEEAADTLAKTRGGVHLLIRQLNQNISTLQSSSISTIINIPYVCDPFSDAPDYEYTPDGCANNTIQIGQISTLLEAFKCSGNDTQQCTAEGKFITQSNFDRAQAYTASIQNLLDIFPELESLTNCSFVKDTFSTILNEQCSSLKSSINQIWIPLIILSTCMIFMVILWISKAHQYGEREFSEGSIIPHDTPINSPKKQQNPSKSSIQMDYIQDKAANQFVLNCT